MTPLRLRKLRPIVVRLNDWVQMEDGSFRCGNVLIRNDGGAGLQEKWRIYRVGYAGRLTHVWPKSRPWAYGHAGQAKIGASHLAKPQEEQE